MRKYLSDEAMIALVRMHLESELNHDWEGVASTFNEEGGYLEFGGTRMEGRNSIAGYYRLLLSGISEARFEEKEIFCEGNMLMTTGTLSGCHSGFALGLPPTGKKFSIPLSAVFEVAEDGTLSYEKLFIDSHTFLHELGFKFHPSNPFNLLLLYLELLLHPITLTKIIWYQIRRTFGKKRNASE